MASCAECGVKLLQSDNNRVMKCNCSAFYHINCSMNVKQLNGFFEKCCPSKADFSILHMFEKMMNNLSAKIEENMISVKNDILNEIEARLSYINGELIKKIETNEAMIEELHEKVTSCEKRIESSNRYDPVETAAEVKDSLMREKNIILFNVPEDDSTGDFSKISPLLVGSSFNDANIKISRIGLKSVNKIRPLKLRCVSSDSAFELFNLLRSKRDSGFKCGFDKTPEERKRIKEVILQLKNIERNGDNSKKLKFVRGIPRIVSKNM